MIYQIAVGPAYAIICYDKEKKEEVFGFMISRRKSKGKVEHIR
jgi:hypothetical protein